MLKEQDPCPLWSLVTISDVSKVIFKQFGQFVLPPVEKLTWISAKKFSSQHFQWDERIPVHSWLMELCESPCPSHPGQLTKWHQLQRAQGRASLTPAVALSYGTILTYLYAGRAAAVPEQAITHLLQTTLQQCPFVLAQGAVRPRTGEFWQCRGVGRVRQGRNKQNRDGEGGNGEREWVDPSQEENGISCTGIHCILSLCPGLIH